MTTRDLSELPRGEFSIDATCPQHSLDDLDPEDEEIFHDCWDGCSPYDVEYAGSSFPPGDGDSLDDPFNGLSVEHFAKKLCDEKDFSSQSCERIVKYVCAKSRNERKRQVAANTCSVALGAYTHGAFHGAIKKTFRYFHVAQYLNKFLRFHGARGPRSSTQLNFDAAINPHKDAHNLLGTPNWTIGLGDYQGGRLWLDIRSADSEETSALCDGATASGLYFNTKDQIQAFDPKRKHGIEQWHGSRCSITAYTVRGVDDLSLPDRDVLSTCGFHLNDLEESGAPRQEKHKDSFRPKKSTRKGLWKGAQRASALFTLSMAAASSFLARCPLLR